MKSDTITCYTSKSNIPCKWLTFLDDTIYFDPGSKYFFGYLGYLEQNQPKVFDHKPIFTHRDYFVKIGGNCPLTLYIVHPASTQFVLAHLLCPEICMVWFLSIPCLHLLEFCQCHSFPPPQLPPNLSWLTCCALRCMVWFLSTPCLHLLGILSVCVALVF